MVAGLILHWVWVRSFLTRWRQGLSRPANFDVPFVFLTIGMMKKTLVADRLYETATVLQDSGTAFGFVDSLTFPFLYAVYLYFDFSAYSDIAMGTAAMVGLQLPVNFYSPYKVPNPMVFWRRWHRTLYKFITNDLRFLFRSLNIPGGAYFVVFVFIFSAYWHGSGLGFLILGVGHLIYFLLYPRKFGEWLYRPIAVAANFAVVALLWVPFALNLEGVGRWAAGFTRFSIGSVQANGLFYQTILSIADVRVVLIGLLIVLFTPNSIQIARSTERYWLSRGPLVIGLIIVSTVILSGVAPPKPFVYFQF